MYNMNLAASSPTALRILTTAEMLFAEHGYAAVSLRQITAAAKVNLAAVNYHFYDKESLYRELLVQRLRQLNTQRLSLLAAAESRAEPGIPQLEDIVYALARPLLMPEPGFGPSAARMLGRLLMEKHPSKSTLLTAEFHPVMIRFGQAIRRHAPTLSPKDFLWRYSLIIGALHHATVTAPDMDKLTQGICSGNDQQGALDNFIRFAAGSLSTRLHSGPTGVA